MIPFVKLMLCRVFGFLLLCCVASLFLGRNSLAQTATWPTHSHDAQHSGVSTVAAQSFSKIHWHTPVDLDPPQGEIFIHYGSPVITAANTVIVPVKTGNNSFRVEGHNGATGTRIWALNTAYKAPSAGFMPGLGPTLFGNNLYTPDTAGGVTARTNPDSATGSVSHVYFYGQANYQADPTLYQKYVQTNTPLTPDAAGNLYFGFLILGSTPIGLQSGLARIAANGTGTWVAAANMSTDSKMTQVATSCAPALSTDGSTLYIVITNGSYGYLVSLNSTTLAPVSQVRLKDPSSGLDAGIPDESSATPTVGPDGDVYFGVLENPFPDHNDRGWMLHYSSDLSQTKIPGSFGWDDTASIVDASLVASYHGTSSYLLMTKYNNYADINTGDGKNKIAILDPNATENDPVIPSVLVMKEVITQLGVTPDPGAGMPGAVKEWCINTAAIDPIGKAVIANSEDGFIYHWDLTLNKLTKRVKLSSGIGEAYTPTLIGSDGTVYGINDAILDAIGQ